MTNSFGNSPRRRISPGVGGSVFAAGILLLATAREARAYTDPGSGALIWQMLMASLVGLAFYFRRVRSWLRALTGKKRDAETDR
jgi:hypothetical protein